MPAGAWTGRVLALVEHLRGSFWFLPSLMTAGAALLSLALLRVDGAIGDDVIRRVGWLYQFGPEGARAVLSAIASSMITVAGLTFSLTMLTLQLASSQFGPRLLRDFMRDRGNQVVLGVFISTFLYCLLVLRSVRGTEGASFVPHLSVAVGVLLALLSLGILIYFIHHVASSIRLETVLGHLADEARRSTDALYPEQIGEGPSDDELGRIRLPDFSVGAQARAKRAGYVQRLDETGLMSAAVAHDLVLRVLARPGRFVVEGQPLLDVVPAERASDETLAAIVAAVVLGDERTHTHDLQFSIDRMVEIAQRALSPGVNDPATALYCIDRLREALLRLAGRPLPSSLRLDENGHPRLLAERVTLEDIAIPALASVARYGAGDARVARALLDLAVELAAAAPQAAAPLRSLAQSIRELALSEAKLPADRAFIASSTQRPG
jgi:uncharacterized membrane protein